MESSWKFSPHIPLYKLVMQKTSGFSEAWAFRHLLRGWCLEDRMQRMLAEDCRVQCRVPTSWPVSLRSVPRKGNREGWGERQNSKKGKTNSRLRCGKNHQQEPWLREHSSIGFQLRLWTLGDTDIQNIRHVLVRPYPKARHVRQMPGTCVKTQKVNRKVRQERRKLNF